MNPEAGRVPGVGVAAATLGLVEATVALAAVVVVLGDVRDSGAGDESFLAIAVLEGLVLLAALTLLGSLFLLRGTGRRLLVGVTIAELVLVLGLVVLAMVVLATQDRSYSGDGVVTAYFVVALAAPTVRLALAGQPAVGSWLSDRRATRSAPWGPAPRSGSGTVVALLAPVALLAVVVVLVVLTSDPPVDYAID